MVVENKKQKPNRIPVRVFGDGEEAEPEREPQSDGSLSEDDGSVSPEEIGESSSYEDETEVQSRIDEGRRVQEEDDKSPRDDSVGNTLERPALGGKDEFGAGSGKAKHALADHPGNGQTQKSEGVSEGPMLAELIATRAELRRVEAEVADYRERLSRRQADFDNYRKRVERDRSDTYNRMVGEVLSKLLPVLDNFRRAFEAEKFVEASESEEFRHFLNGVELIFRQLEDVLEGLGLEPVAAVGQPFDPHIHEAVVTEETDDYEPDTVIQELARGYRLGDKLLRPAMVKVATRH